MDRPLLVLPPHQAVFIASRDALVAYLKDRGVRTRVRQDRVMISLDIGEYADSVIMVDWLDDQVRFVAQVALDMSTANLAEAALLVEKINEDIGFPVWRVLPSLSATYTVTLDHTRALSSRVVEYAIALIQDALLRDPPVFSAQLGVGPP